MRTLPLIAALCLAPSVLAQQGGTPAGAPRPGVPARPAPAPTGKEVAAHIRERIESVLRTLDDDLHFDAAQKELNALFDQAVAYGPIRDEALLADAYYARQLVLTLSRVKAAERNPAYALLRQHDEIGRTLVFLLRPQDQIADVLAVLARLQAAHGERIARYPALTCALCVVHDVPLPLGHATEAAPYADPVALFTYFTRNEKKLQFPPGSLPAEVLIYMVNSRANIEEMEWALFTHGGDRNVGKRYHDLTYDTGFFKFNRPKKIDGHPYTLQNLRKFGGVCADQAYYAAQIGKAIGVPTVQLSGKGSDVGHAWVGFLQRHGTTWVLNCDEGVHGQYERLRSQTPDPQTGKHITQSQVEVLVGLAGTKPQERFAAAGLIEAARRIRGLSYAKNPNWPPEPLEEGWRPTRPSLDLAAQLAMLERATALAPASPDVWLAGADWAQSMRPGDRENWFRAVNKATSHAMPDFAFGVTCALFASIKDTGQQASAWDWLRKQYTRRPDLACRSLERKGDLLAKVKDKDGALAAYSEAAKTYSNDGPFFLDPLDKAEKLLRDAKRVDAVANLIGDVFRRTSKPSTMSENFEGASNYHKIGLRYIEVLEELGRTREAEAVKRQIKMGGKP